MKVVTVVGARPQLIKAAVVARAFSKYPNEVKEVIVHTGQHYDSNMSDVFFAELAIPKPDYFLGIGGGTHGQNTGRMIECIEELLIAERPDWVLVFGDTDSTLAGAIAAAKLNIPIAHIEAGLRSFNRNMPEEINRVLTDHLSSKLFVPTKAAIRNLQREGISDSGVVYVGDVMYDASLFYRSMAKKPKWFDEFVGEKGPYVLATVHRAENTDSRERLMGILRGLERAAVPVVLPLHPRTRSRLESLGFQVPVNITTVDPVGYLEMVWLEAHCAVVVTDSGGVQKEAYFYQKPCVTTRYETEWEELVDGGANVLVGADELSIARAITAGVHRPISDKALYGDGNAADLIVQSLLDHVTV